MHPLNILDPADMEIARLWRLSRRGDGAGVALDPGGFYDQAAYMVDAFAIMDSADAKLRPDDDSTGRDGLAAIGAAVVKRGLTR